MIDPITREEFLLAKALGENVPDIVPVIRKEMYLAKIAGADIQTPEAITREEMYLDAIANGTEVNIEPITRKEMFYAKALGLIENAPEPITRIEGLLNQITVGGGGGSYDKYSWEGVFASIKAGTYATDYAIGDMIPLNLGSEGLINMQIAAFDTDDLADGSGKAHITWIAKELLNDKKPMNSTQKTHNGTTAYNAGGWSSSDMRSYCNDVVLNMIPENVRTNIKNVNKLSDGGKVDPNLIATIDMVWIPSVTEVYGTLPPHFYYVKGQGNIYPLFSDDASRIKKYGSSASRWWLRSTITNWDSNMYCIEPEGYIGHKVCYETYRVCICFCT